MLNPSTADADQDDQTIRRCTAFSRAFGCGGLVVVNLYGFRATDPRELRSAEDPVGPENDDWLTRTARAARLNNSPLIAAWGAHAGADRVAAVLAIPGMERLTALATTRAGQPRHPSRLPNGLTPVPWMPPPAVPTSTPGDATKSRSTPTAAGRH